jgi:hypothetical protein
MYEKNHDHWHSTLEGLYAGYKEATQALNAHRKLRRRMTAREGIHFNNTRWTLEYKLLLSTWHAAHEAWYKRWQQENFRPFDRSASPPE